jgi:hypothetical protein
MKSRTLLNDNKGQGGLLSLAGMAAIVLVVAYVIASVFLGTGARPIASLCQGTIGGVIQNFPCNQIPLEAVGVTVAQGAAAQPAGGVSYQVNVSTIAFTVNPLEKYLNGTAAPTMTVSPRVNGSWLADFNTQTGTTLPVQQPFEYLVGKDTGSGTDYYSKYVSGRNSGLVSPLTDSVQFAREGTLTSTATNQDGVTLNASAIASMASIAPSQTYYFNLKEDMLTAYAAFGNPDSTSKVLMVIDYNALDFSKVSPYGIAYTSGAGVPPTHSRDANASTSVAYVVPDLGLDYLNSSKSFKIKAEALSTGLPVSAVQSRIKLTFYDYTKFKNTETGAVEDAPYNPVTSADVGVANPTKLLYYLTT